MPAVAHVLVALTVVAMLMGLYRMRNSNDIVCFEDLDCFETGYPWTSPLRPVPPPQSPEKTPTTLFFFSRGNLNEPYVIKTYPVMEVGDAPVNSQLPTVLIIHGFDRNATSKWMRQLKNVYLDNMDANIFLVDWSVGALKKYTQSVSDTRVVGRLLANFLSILVETKDLKPERVHLIGHSLGAQIAAYTAKEFPGIGRLTALDPAQPGYENCDMRVRLDRSDAVFVEVVHTDPKPFIPFLGLGMVAPHGHVDFYFNIGLKQPGCITPDRLPNIGGLADLAKFPIDFAYWKFMCSHERAPAYLIEAYNKSSNCHFLGHRASLSNVAKSFANGLTMGILPKLKVHSESCARSNCVRFGLDTIDSSPTGIFLVTTNNAPPYCVVEHEQ